MPNRALDPDFMIMARCDLGGVPGASFAAIIERCQAYKAEAQARIDPAQVRPADAEAAKQLRNGFAAA
jgi:2-methylisocitrate lyase-like PEP mutase family enzyme